MSLTTISIIASLIGGLILFFFGGLNIGGGQYVADEPTPSNKIAKTIGLALVLASAIIQLYSSNH